MTETSSHSHLLLNWYAINGRDLPWRECPPDHFCPDPYHVWLSEVMLQQTTVIVVKPYFTYFLQKWPTIADLAHAPLEDVLDAWAGLGYYARARNMHKCAQILVQERNGRFPETEEELIKLPSIGPYTAAAIAAIAFRQPATVVDGNVERIISRHFAITTPLPKAKKEIYDLAKKLTPKQGTDTYTQAIMDLGATVCKPRNPSCHICPWEVTCKGRETEPTAFPIKLPKKKKPTHYGYAIWHETLDQHILMVRRPPKGLLSGMICFPSTLWTPEPPPPPEGKILPGIIKHTFTHFHLSLKVIYRKEAVKVKQSEFLCKIADLSSLRLPSLMNKVYLHTNNIYSQITSE